MDTWFDLVPFLFLLLLGLVAGGIAERRHLRNLDERERGNNDFFITQVREFIDAASGPRPPTLIIGEAVIGSDYLKTFFAGLRRIFGGELRSYQTLLTRARREALQRVVESAKAQGFNAVCNVRFDSADVGGSSKAKRIPMASVMASATAYYRASRIS